MADFAWVLSRTAATGDRVVLDRTGLQGRYDFELKFERDARASAGASPADPVVRREEGPSIFTALQEQLGLRLEARKGPVEFLVVDSVSRPSPN